MLRSMFSGLAGLSNNQTGLDVVGNNIANVNTIGYKGSKIEFTELLNQTIRGASSPQASGRGGTNPIQVGLGVGTSAISVSHQQGNLLSTGLMSDLALQGNGFFILGDGGTQQFYSRAGSFNFDADGFLVHSSGMKAYGWMANSAGTINTNDAIQALSIPVGQTISANETTEITYAYNLDSRAYTIGTPLLASGNSANVSTTTGKFLKSIDDPTTLTNNEAITDVIGTHTVQVYAETHNGTNSALNGTQKLGDDLKVTNTSSFRIVIDGVENTINLSNGTASTVNELISAINSQLPGVTAILSGGKIQLTRDVAGATKHVYVYDSNSLNSNCFSSLTSTSAHGAATEVTTSEAADIWSYLTSNIPGHAATTDTHAIHAYIDSTGKVLADAIEIAALDLSAVPKTGGGFLDFSDLTSSGQTLLTEALADHVTSNNGIAANCFGTGTTEWLPASTSLGTKTSLTLTSALTGIDVANDIQVTTNGSATPTTFDVSAEGLTATSTVADLITAFNTWSALETSGTTLDKFYMGLNKDGKLFVTYETANNDNPITIADKDASNIVKTGIVDTFFSKAGDWSADLSAAKLLSRLSKTAHVTHSFSRADGGGTTLLPVAFDATDTRIEGITGVEITATSAGFKTGSFVMQTVPATEHLTSSTVYDSLGNEHTVTLNLTRTSDNTWNWDASGTEVAGSGELVFDNLGVISTGANIGAISVGAVGGSNPLTIKPNFEAVSQYADISTMVHSGQDGYPNGSLSTYSISSDGTIIGIYSNGLNQNIGQIAIATFNNPTGLLKGSDGMFMSSNNSGDVQIGLANTGGRGTISAGTLEMSNVDIAKEFANMIIYQRGFQANSKIITTGDEILQTLVNMKR